MAKTLRGLLLLAGCSGSLLLVVAGAAFPKPALQKAGHQVIAGEGMETGVTEGADYMSSWSPNTDWSIRDIRSPLLTLALLVCKVAGSADTMSLSKCAGHEVVALQSVKTSSAHDTAQPINDPSDLTLIPCSLGCLVAGKAHAGADADHFRGDQVVPGKWVSLAAVSSCGVSRTDSLSAQHVFALRGGATVQRITAPAPAIVADVMVKPHADRYWADFSLVPEPVHQMALVEHGDHGVPVVVSAPRPDVAPPLVLDPPERRLNATPRGKVADHFALGFRYFRMYAVAYFRRHALHLPSAIRVLAVNLCPRLQNMRFMSYECKPFPDYRQWPLDLL